MYRVLCESNVKISEINQYLTLLSEVIYNIYKEYSVFPIITSGNDGKHMENSFHYQGLAWDFKIWNLPKSKRSKVADKLRKKLYSYDHRWQVVYGDKNHLDHIHIEFDLNRRKNSIDFNNNNSLYTTFLFFSMLFLYIEDNNSNDNKSEE